MKTSTILVLGGVAAVAAYFFLRKSAKTVTIDKYGNAVDSQGRVRFVDGVPNRPEDAPGYVPGVWQDSYQGGSKGGAPLPKGVFMGPPAPMPDIQMAGLAELRGMGGGSALLDSLTSVLAGNSTVKTQNALNVDASNSTVTAIAIGGLSLVSAAYFIGGGMKGRRRRRKN